MGDAGAIVTNQSKLAENMTSFARHGGLKKGIHKIEGIIAVWMEFKLLFLM